MLTLLLGCLGYPRTSLHFLSFLVASPPEALLQAGETGQVWVIYQYPRLEELVIGPFKIQEE